MTRPTGFCDSRGPRVALSKTRHSPHSGRPRLQRDLGRGARLRLGLAQELGVRLTVVHACGNPSFGLGAGPPLHPVVGGEVALRIRTSWPSVGWSTVSPCVRIVAASSRRDSGGA